MHIKSTLKTPRKLPKQGRSTAKFNLILEAAARILETEGLRSFNTNAVSVLAGVSPGTLYQYFPNKHSIIFALVVRQLEEVFLATLAETDGVPDDKALAAFIETAVLAAQRRPKLTAILIASEPMMVLAKVKEELPSGIQGLTATVLMRHGIAERHLDMAVIDTLGIVKGMLLASAGHDGLGDPGLTVRIKACVVAYLSQVDELIP
ncbi:TetR/AcrR family transcriptional regulator [Xanthomonas euvesicatoria]|uniref:TetR/AcrR family transcriptional regulator n=1 Tax=Xanthomonas euvesicatoria TaxID=456327 RepID=UPI0030C8715A